MGLFNRRAKAPVEQVEQRDSGLFNPYPYYSSLNPTSLGTGSIDESCALNVSAFLRAIDLKAEAVATLPLQAFIDHTKLEADTVPQLVRQFTPNKTNHKVLKAWIMDYQLYGNAFGVFYDYDINMFPQRIMPVNATDVSVVVDTNGSYLYRINKQLYSPFEVFHVANIIHPSDILGKGILELGATALHTAKAASDRAYQHLKDGKPPYALVHEEKLNKEQKNEILMLWENAHVNSSRPAVLDQGLDIKELGFNSLNLQLLETRHFSIVEIANLTGVPSYFLNYVDGSSYTYSSAGDLATHFVKYTLEAITTSFEDAFTQALPDGIDVKFNLDGILRGDPTTRTNVIVQELQNNICTINEARALLDKPPLPNGDVTLAEHQAKYSNINKGTSL